jgi:hypothetical protein
LGSLWGRWKSPDAIGLKTLWIKKQSITNKRTSITIEGQAVLPPGLSFAIASLSAIKGDPR